MCPAEWRRTIEQWGCVYICMWRHIVVKSVYLCVCVFVVLHLVSSISSALSRLIGTRDKDKYITLLFTT